MADERQDRTEQRSVPSTRRPEHVERPQRTEAAAVERERAEEDTRAEREREERRREEERREAPVEHVPDDLQTRIRARIRKVDPEWEDGDPTWHLNFDPPTGEPRAVHLVGDISEVRRQRTERRRTEAIGKPRSA